MDGFLDRLRIAVDNSDYKSLRQISIDSELSENNLANILNNSTIENSKSGPGFFAIARICKTLGITPNFLAGINDIDAAQASPVIDEHASGLATALAELVSDAKNRPSESRLFGMFIRGGARLEAFEHVMEYCDLLEAPSSPRPLHLLHVAPKGMTAKAIGTLDVEKANLAVQTTADECFRENMLAAHRKTEANGYLVTIEDINVTSQSIAKRIRESYVRYLFCVEDAKGKKYILNHARPL